MGELYRVIFQGDIDENFSKRQVIQNLKKSLKAPEAKIEKLFSGKVVSIKNNLTKSQAETLSVHLKKIGVLARVSPVSEDVSKLKKTGNVALSVLYFSGLIKSLFAWIAVVVFFLIGLVLMLSFSPFPDFVVRRGLLFGVFFFICSLFGMFRLMAKEM